MLNPKPIGKNNEVVCCPLDKNIWARVVDAAYYGGSYITTMIVNFPRFILAEFNTHRIFSRNSASSRAVPTLTLLANLRQNPFYPVEYTRLSSGMSGQKGLLDDDERVIVDDLWETGVTNAAALASSLRAAKLHKSLGNRVLEPFLYHRVIVTSTEWQNFFNQRCTEFAQPEMRELAYAMRDAFENRLVNEYPNDYLPLAPEETDFRDALVDLALVAGDDWRSSVVNDWRIICSVVSCARVSYGKAEAAFDNSTNISARDSLRSIAKTFLVLAKNGHWSPFEHQAVPCSHLEEINVMEKEAIRYGIDALDIRCKYQGNFGRGWHQLRQLMQKGGVMYGTGSDLLTRLSRRCEVLLEQE